MSDPTTRLHPSMQYHIVNTLQWPALRPLQRAAIDPVLDGSHGLLLAPTAGGKTEAASFSVLSRVANEQWAPMSVLYLAPLRALLNNLLPRLETYAGFVGRRAALWHGDTGQAERARLLTDPPDVLLTTPESLESMLISRRVDHARIFANLRTVVIDEVHAFAAADRGWHMLAVLERLSRLANRDLQRIGLSATVGNPDELLAWLCGSSNNARQVINPPAEAVAEPEITLDYVGSLENAATVIDRLYRGEKRLVFVDSRRRVEELASALNARGTTTFVSHGSLGQAERRRSESAFAEASDCVIVATSTLELGIDVGDLDRVIQIDSPPTVAGFLQRIGRSGRRAGTSRNMLFLATSTDALLRAAGLLHLWGSGYVEPACAPVYPAHLLVQQILALSLQEADRGLGRHTWKQWLGGDAAFGSETMSQADGLLDELLSKGWLHEDGGVLGPGLEAERRLGKRNFLELTSVFVAPAMVSVRQGRIEIGQVPDAAIIAAFDQPEGSPSLLLAGQSWRITNVDWKRRIAHVEPNDQLGKVRFPGDPVVLSYELCQAMASILAGAELTSISLTARATDAIDELRDHLPWVRPDRTLLVPAETGQRWYTFAGLRANLELAARLRSLRTQISQKDNLYITIDGKVDRADLAAALAQPTPMQELGRLVGVVGGALKLQNVIPDPLIADVLVRRFRDVEAVERVVVAPVDRIV